MMNYQYETSPRKIYANKPKKKKKKAYLITTIKNTTKAKDNSKINIKLALILVFSMLFIIIYRNSMINESFSKLQGLKKQTTALQKENDQLEVNIQNSINLNNIETAAKVQLGMQKLTASQTEYIALPKQDYVEASAEVVILNENKTLLESLKEKIINLF